MLQMLHKCVCICIYICCVKIVTCLCRICLWWSYVSILRDFWNYTKRCRRIGRTVQVQVSAVVAELLQCDSCMWNLFMLVKCGDDELTMMMMMKIVSCYSWIVGVSHSAAFASHLGHLFISMKVCCSFVRLPKSKWSRYVQYFWHRTVEVKSRQALFHSATECFLWAAWLV